MSTLTSTTSAPNTPLRIKLPSREATTPKKDVKGCAFHGYYLGGTGKPCSAAKCQFSHDPELSAQAANEHTNRKKAKSLQDLIAQGEQLAKTVFAHSKAAQLASNMAVGACIETKKVAEVAGAAAGAAIAASENASAAAGAAIAAAGRVDVVANHVEKVADHVDAVADHVDALAGQMGSLSSQVYCVLNGGLFNAPLALPPRPKRQF